MPPYKTSMLLDYENGHPMETEAILGNALRANPINLSKNSYTINYLCAKICL
jgi:hypothetical protein